MQQNEQEQKLVMNVRIVYQLNTTDFKPKSKPTTNKRLVKMATLSWVLLTHSRLPHLYMLSLSMKQREIKMLLENKTDRHQALISSYSLLGFIINQIHQQ